MMNSLIFHAVFSPSNAHRWSRCTASVLMERYVNQHAPYDNGDESGSAYAKRGFDLHALAREIIDQQNNALLESSSLDLNADEKAAIASYVDYVNALGGLGWTETLVEYDHYVPGGFGTADFIAIDQSDLTVVDFKSGQGNIVSAFKNEQLILYAAGALQSFPTQCKEVDTVKLVVHQSIVDNVSEWVLSREEIQEAARALGDMAIEGMSSQTAQFRPSITACQYCAAKGQCKARSKAQMKVLGFYEKNNDAFIEPAQLSADELGQLFPRLSAIKGWVRDVEAHVHQQLTTGETITGLTLAQGRSKRSWQDEKRAANTLVDAGLSQDALYSEPALLSVAKVEKLLDKDKRALLEPLITVSHASPKVVVDKDAIAKRSDTDSTTTTDLTTTPARLSANDTTVGFEAIESSC